MCTEVMVFDNVGVMVDEDEEEVIDRMLGETGRLGHKVLQTYSSKHLFDVWSSCNDISGLRAGEKNHGRKVHIIYKPKSKF